MFNFFTFNFFRLIKELQTEILKCYHIPSTQLLQVGLFREQWTRLNNLTPTFRDLTSQVYRTSSSLPPTFPLWGRTEFQITAALSPETASLSFKISNSHPVSSCGHGHDLDSIEEDWSIVWERSPSFGLVLCFPTIKLMSCRYFGGDLCPSPYLDADTSHD